MKNFNQIYSENYTKILNYVTWKIGNFHDAEDITSNVFMKVSQNLDNFNPDKSSFNTWLHTIANNSIIDFIRSEANRKANTLHVSNFVDSETGKEYIELPDNSNNNSKDSIETKELRRKLAMAFRSLKPQYRKIAVLFFLQELEYKEIAKIANVPMGTVKGVISRARIMLQQELKTQKISI